MSLKSDAIIVSVAVLLLILAFSITPNSITYNPITGFAISSVYSGYAIPINGVVVDNNLNFANVADMVQKSLDVSDDIIYRKAYVSFDGSSWSSFNLTPSGIGSISGEWIYNRGTASLSFTPIKLNLNTVRTSSNNTYIIIYTCSKNTTIHNWSCHDGWQIIKFDAKLNTVSSISPTITFVTPPTPASGSTINTSSQQIVATVADDSNSISSWIDFDKSLVGYWSMDYYSNAGIFDNSSYKNFGTFAGGLSANNIITGVRGKGLSFDGIDDYIEIGNVASLNLPSTDLTLSAWINLRNCSTANAFIHKYLQYSFAVINFSSVCELTYADSSDWSFANFGYYGSVSSGVWHHVVVTKNQSNVVTIYLDGTSIISKNFGGSITASSNSLLIGAYKGINNYFFSGSIDEVIIFNRALSVSEVKTLYNSQVNKFNATFSNLANGQHTYSVYAIDGDGNLASSNQRIFNVNALINCNPSCSNSHGTTSCSSSGICQPVCLSNYDDCDGSLANGCETQLGTILNCASCADSCSSGETCISNVCTTTSVPPPTSTVGNPELFTYTALEMDFSRGTNGQYRANDGTWQDFDSWDQGCNWGGGYCRWKNGVLWVESPGYGPNAGATRTELVPNAVGSGRVLRAWIEQGDMMHNSATYPRTEFYSDETTSEIPFDSEWRVEIPMYMSGNLQTPGDTIVGWQMHRNGDVSSPPLEFDMNDGLLKLSIFDSDIFRTYNIFTVQSYSRFDVVMDLKFGYASEGAYFKMWVNGTKYVDITDMDIGFPGEDAVAGWWKFCGQYDWRSTVTGTRSLYCGPDVKFLRKP